MCPSTLAKGGVPPGHLKGWGRGYLRKGSVMRVTTAGARRVVMLLGGLALLLTACGGDDAGAEVSETTVASTTTTEGTKAVPLSLKFDGESCTYEGPTELTAGPVELTFFNESDGVAAVNLREILEGKTVKDVIEYNGPEPWSKQAPSWTRAIGTLRQIPPGESQHWEGDLEPAGYFMVCIDWPAAVWLGTGLRVEG